MVALGSPALLLALNPPSASVPCEVTYFCGDTGPCLQMWVNKKGITFMAMEDDNGSAWAESGCATPNI